MKKCFWVLMLCLLLPVGARAAGSQTGIYLAPKFIYGIEITKLKGKVDPGETLSIGTGASDVFGGALAVGYDFSRKFDLPVRLEVEYAGFSQGEGAKTFRENGVKVKSKIEVQSLFANIYYDFRNESRLSPYVGAGLGLAFVNMKGSLGILDSGPDFSFSGKNQTNFAWNVGLGCAYDFTESFALDLGYRYADLGKAESGSENLFGFVTLKGKADRVAMHQFVLAARFTF